MRGCQQHTSLSFERAVAYVLRLEGGYVDRESDPGGETNFGISRRQYPDLDIRNLSRQDAAYIYWRDYWLPNMCDRIEYVPLQAHFFAAVVVSGARPPAKALQRALNELGSDLKVDGRIGPHTLSAVNTAHPDMGLVLNGFFSHRAEFYLGLGNPANLKGWIRRMLSIPHEVA